MILAGDVGGTKCNLALFSENGGKLTSVFKQRFASKDFAQFDLIVREFSLQAAPHLAKERVRAAGFGVAGPVIDNRVRATNLPWTVDAAVLASELKLSDVVLMNDLGATGHSIEHLCPEEYCVLNAGTPEHGGTRALLALAPAWANPFLFGMAHGIALCPRKAVIPILLLIPNSRSSSSATCAAAILK